MNGVRKPILNREFKMPTDEFVHLQPIGEHPVVIEDDAGNARRVIQVVDKKSCDAVVADFKNRKSGDEGFELLVDYDHESLDMDKSTRAAAWVDDVVARDDGVWGHVRLTNSGREAIEGGDFRYISPVYDPSGVEDAGDGRIRPLAIDCCAVTNDPNMKNIRPITNRGTGAADLENPAGGRPATQSEGEKNMKELKELFGLPETATDQEVLAKAKAMKAQVEELEKAAAEGQADKDLEEFADVIENREEVRKQLITNREGTVMLLKSLKAPAKNGKLRNRRDIGRPATSSGDGEQSDEETAAEKKRAGKIANRASDLMSANPRLHQADAFRQAEAEVGDGK